MRTDITPIPRGAVYAVPEDVSHEWARGVAGSLGLRVVVYGSARYLVQPEADALPAAAPTHPVARADTPRRGTHRPGPWARITHALTRIPRW